MMISTTLAEDIETLKARYIALLQQGKPPGQDKGCAKVESELRAKVRFETMIVMSITAAVDEFLKQAKGG